MRISSVFVCVQLRLKSDPPVPLDMGFIVAFEVGRPTSPHPVASRRRRPYCPPRRARATTERDTMTIAIFGIFFILAMSAGLFVAGQIPGTTNWVFGGVSAALGLGGLFVAARSGPHEPVGYYGGIVFFLVALLIVFYLVKLALDEAEKHRQH
jgi:hypothetical protein